MRLIIHLSICCLTLTLAACHTSKSTNRLSSTGPSQQQRNLAADKVLLSVFETGDVAKLDAVIDPAFINHIGTEDRVGLDNLKTMIQGFHARMKSVKVELKRQLSDEEYVSDWVRFTGRDPGAVIEGMEVTRYANGKAVEHWFFPNSQARQN
jgi:predicted SnoaL-like aldol condensation-catalyzing enzyme